MKETNCLSPPSSLLLSLSSSRSLAHTQNHSSRWDFWFEGVLLLTETMCHDERKGSCHGPTRAVVEWALGLLEAVKERNRNEAVKVEHAEAILKSRYSDEYKAIL